MEHNVVHNITTLRNGREKGGNYFILKINRKLSSPVSTHRNSTGYARPLGDLLTTRTSPLSSTKKGQTSTSLKKKREREKPNFQGILSY